MVKLGYNSKTMDNISIIQLSGGLDIETSDILNKNIEDFIEKGITQFVVNMNNVEYLSSAGLGALIILDGVLKKCNGEIKICATDDTIVTRIFQLHGIIHLFEVYNDEESAIKAFIESAEDQ